MTQPTITVSLGQLTGWQLGTAGSSELGVTTTLATYVYTPITSRVIDFSIRRGRQHELDRIETGTATATLINQDGAVTPTNTSSVYYPDIRPMVPIKIQATYPPPAAFAPTDIPGLKGWYSFDDIATLFKDTARTVPVTADADVIKGVTDKSGQGNHLSEATNGPAYKVGVQNGLSAALYDATNDILAAATLSGGNFVQPTFVAAVMKTGALATNAAAFDGIGANRNHVYIEGSTADHFKYYAGSDIDTGDVASMSTAYIVTTLFNGASSQLWADGVSLSTANAGTQVLSGFTVGNNVVPNAAFGGHICEVLFYDNLAPSSAQHNELGGYLASKWGTTWTTV